MGDLVKLSKDEWVPWTGGKPNYDWTGLDLAEALSENTSPNQLCGDYAAAAQKGYNYRRTGLTVVFKKNDDLQVFAKNVWNHLLDTGMDTIAYLRDPEYSNCMTDVIHGHSRFTVASTKKLSKDQAMLFDKHDRTNDKAARTFLLASLETNLRNRVEEKLEDCDSFVVTWLTFIKSIQSTSIDRFNALKTRIKGRSPTQYPGENLESLARDFCKDAQELETAGQYDHLLTLDMIKAFLLAGGQGNEDYRFNLRPMKQKLETALLDIAYKTKEAANKHMKDEELTYNDVCILAEDTYRLLFDKKEWPPAQNARDSKAPRAAYVGEIGSALTEAQVLTLIQSHLDPSSSAGAAGKKGGSCHHCKKPGHWKNECPDLKGKGGGLPGGGGGGGKAQGRTDGKGGGWRTTPPKSGEPETKMVNGRKFDWCLKCKRWTTTHNTNTHTGGAKSPDGAKKLQAHGQLAFVPDPSAWFASVSDDDTLEWSDIWGLFLPYLLFSLIGFVLGQIWSPQTIFWFVVKLFLANPFGLIAPLFWISCLGALFHWSKTAPPDPSPNPWPSYSRHERRAYTKMHRTSRRRHHHARPGSIRHHGLHRSYPRRLRDQGLYTGKAPTLDCQDMLRNIQHLHFYVQQLTSKVMRLLNARPSRPCYGGTHLDHAHLLQKMNRHFGKTGRKGENVNPGSTTNFPTKRQPRPHGRRPDEAKYRPVPPMGLVWSQGMRSMARKLAVHANMANVSGFNPATLRMALQAPIKFRTARSKQSEYPIIWDTGASISITMDRGDFVGPIEQPGFITSVTGLSNGLRIEGKGHVMWAFEDENGHLRCIKIRAYLVPKARTRLLSVMDLLATYPDERLDGGEGSISISGVEVIQLEAKSLQKLIREIIFQQPLLVTMDTQPMTFPTSHTALSMLLI